jgi:hypothetical protein
MFSVGAFIVDSFKAFITIKLYLFWKLSIPQSMCIYLFAWRQTHEAQFLNFFFVKSFFWVFGFQIETKKMFNLASVLIALKHYHLQVETFHHIIIVVKNW